MAELFLQVLNLSLVGSWVILLVLLVRLLLRKSPRWCSYLLWGVVFLRLALPVFPESDFSLVPAGLQVASGTIEEVLTKEADAAEEQSVISGHDNVLAGEADAAEEQNTTSGNIVGEDGVEKQDTIDSATANIMIGQTGDSEVVILACLWLAGVTGFGSYHALSYYNFKRQIIGAVQISEGIYQIKGEHLSFVAGIFKPAIYLSGELDEESRTVVLCHEQVHLQRRDYLIKPAALTIACVHWFNPLVWLAFYQMNKDCEMSCDEKVVSILGEESKKVYSYALLDEATRGERLRGKRDNACAVLSFGEDSIKSRISHVLRFKEAPMWLLICSITILIILLAGLLSNRGMKDYSAAVGLVCSAKSYEHTEDGGYLTLVIFENEDGEREAVVKVTASKLQEQLSESEMSEIKGVNMSMNIPGEVLWERKVDVEDTDAFTLLQDDYYDQYLEVHSVTYLTEEDKLDAYGAERYRVDAQKVLEYWANAFVARDKESLQDLSYDEEEFSKADIFGGFEDTLNISTLDDDGTYKYYEIMYEAGAEEASICYWVSTEASEVFAMREIVKLVKDRDLHYVEHVETIVYTEVDTEDQFLTAYGEEIKIRYAHSYMRNVARHVLEGTNPELYDGYKNPVTAAKILLHLGEGNGEVMETLYEARSQNPAGSTAYHGLGEGSVVKIKYTFYEDGSSIYVPMVLAEESMGLWALSKGDLTAASMQDSGPLPGENLVRSVLEELTYHSDTYQISSYGIYKISENEFENIFLQRMHQVDKFRFDDGKLYFPVDSDYRNDDEAWKNDSICELDVETGEYRYISFPQAAWVNDDTMFAVNNGFVSLTNTRDGMGDGWQGLPDAEEVWNGKTTAELTEEEREAYGAFNREYLLTHPGEIMRIGNRYEDHTEAYVDMDGDGNTEKISLAADSTVASEYQQFYDYHVLSVNGNSERRYAYNLVNQIWAFSPDGENIYIALYADGPSADPETTIFRYKDGKLLEAGQIQDYIENLTITDNIEDYRTVEGQGDIYEMFEGLTIFVG